MEHTSPVQAAAGDVCRHAGVRLRKFAQAGCLLLPMLLVSQAGFADRFAPAVVPFHFEHGFAVVVPVSINGSGPYPFLLDTGATITALDRDLAQEVVLDGSGVGTVTTLAETMSVSLAVAHTISIGPVTERDVDVMVRNLKGLHAFAPGVRGVLGQNALNHADFLLDYRHRTLAFDTDGALLASLNGHHMPLTRKTVEDNPQYTNLAVHATIASDGVHPMDFLLDSGTASLVLFDGRLLNAQTSVRDIEGSERTAELRTQQLLIDGRLKQVAAHTIGFHAAGTRIGGLLPTDLFTRLYISNSGSFAIFEPKEKKRGTSDAMTVGVQECAVHIAMP